jgi:hypothetical protein
MGAGGSGDDFADFLGIGSLFGELALAVRRRAGN